MPIYNGNFGMAQTKMVPRSTVTATRAWSMKIGSPNTKENIDKGITLSK